MSRLYQTSHPSQYEKDKANWRNKITNSTNENTARIDDHESLISPKVQLTGATAKLLAALARSCPNGLHLKIYSESELLEFVPDEKSEAIVDATYECILIERLPFLSGPLRIRLTDFFYFQLDPQIMGWSPVEDAVTIAKLLEQTSGRTADVHAAGGMTARQFNPGFRYLLDHLEGCGLGGLISREIQAEYPSSYIVLTPEVRAALRRFIC